ncbi:uncharacterized protein V1510DRAFT_414895 [Dipodascopsis tothii]|uniref:uncharacterized protein n=1 Tax=Dipodascopsis tothii TaxID=44089 RepID=UPI0034CEA9E4
MDSITSAVEGLPGYSYAMDAWNTIAGEKFQTKDPYFEENAEGEEVRRLPPPGVSDSDAEAWKKIVRSAWKHDRCMCGCFWADCGLGQAPLVSLIPVIGPLTMYVLHLRLNRMAEDIKIPTELHVKMTANVTFDFLMTLIPLLGAVFSYINACSTRNAALVYNYLHAKGAENLKVRAAQSALTAAAGPI